MSINIRLCIHPQSGLKLLSTGTTFSFYFIVHINYASTGYISTGNSTSFQTDLVLSLYVSVSF